jgi:SAM-dependent methyltransferase
MDEGRIINKTMSFADLGSDEARRIMAELDALVVALRAKGLKISSWYGEFDLSGDPSSFEQINRGYGYTPLAGAIDDLSFPWFLYWEIVWVVLNSGLEDGQRILDLGGSSSLFSFYLASKGFSVATVDVQRALVDNANHVAREMKWDLQNHAMDMKRMSFGDRFDHITSICVYEHIPMFDRVEINRNIRDLLADGGRFSITFDYRNPSRFARIDSPDDVQRQFVSPSELAVRGNAVFEDTGQNYLLHPMYHPGTELRRRVDQVRQGHFGLLDLFKTKRANDYTFGALFLEKQTA